MRKIILTERSQQQDQRHQLVVRIVDFESAWHNLGSLCLGEDKAANPCNGCVHLDLSCDQDNGRRYLIGEIHNKKGNFRGSPEQEGDGALQVGSRPRAQQNPCIWPPLGERSIPNGATPRGASACWGGTIYESWRSYRKPEHAVAYLKRYFEILADGFNEKYTQEWIDQECREPSPEECAIDTSTTKSHPNPKVQRPQTTSVAAPTSSKPPIPDGFSQADILKQVVDWIHLDPFQRRKRHTGKISPVASAPVVIGWEKRVEEYAYAKLSGPHFIQVYQDTLPMIFDLDNLRTGHKWTADMPVPPSKIVSEVAKLAEKICFWGGVIQKDYSEAWQVLRDAVSGRDHGSKMNSGWTKVASFATDGMAGNEQTIWDSRVATSIIWRVDQILQHGVVLGHITDAQAQAQANHFGLGTVASLNVGTRPRALHYRWPNGYGKWEFHFKGSALVREIVSILNDPANKYPRMPQPIFDPNFKHTGQRETDWTVFGVGLVLFMDGW